MGDGPTPMRPGTMLLVLFGCHEEPGSKNGQSHETQVVDTAGEYAESVSPTGGWADFSSSFTYDCALTEDGAAVCGFQFWDYASGPWGPVDLYVPSDPMVQLDAADNGACGVLETGEALCWAVFGTECDDPWCFPPDIGFRQVSAFWGTACGIALDATITCWSVSCGFAWFGSDTDDTECGPMDPPDGEWSQLEVVGPNACALRADGSVECWGSFVPLMHFPDPPYVDLDYAGCCACAVTDDGRIECDGDTDFWSTEDQSAGSELLLQPPDGGAVDLDIDADQGCAILSDGTLACWGAGTRVPEGRFVRIDVGGAGACGVRDDGHLVCWGYKGFQPDLSDAVPPS